MQLPTIATIFLGLATFASAEPLSPAAIIEQIAPDSVSCEGKSDECRTAEQAAPFIFDSMCQYGIQDPNQIAAIISLMAFECGQFVYKRNAFPGRPGQGTANMQMPPFNLKYAQSLEGVRDEVANVTTTEGQSDAELNRILDLVTVDEYNFGSGPWFVKSECAPEVLESLKQDIDTGFEAYMACVGVEVNEERLVFLERAKVAFDL